MVEERVAIQNQFNVSGSDINSINILNKENEFVDPTEPFPKINKVYEFENEFIDSISESLSKNRIIVISSYSRKIAESAIIAVLTNKLFKDKVECRSLRLSLESEPRDDITLDVFKNKTLGKGENIVFAVSGENQVFFNSIFEIRDTNYTALNSSISFAEAYKEQLAKRNYYVIIIISNENYISLLNERSNYLLFPKYHLPYLDTILNNHFEAEQARKYKNELQKQQLKGRWGKKEIDMFEYISRYLNSGKEELLYQIGKRSSDENTEKNNFKPRKHFKKDYLYRHVCFIISFFPSLSNDEFSLLMEEFLSDDEKIEQYKKNIIDKGQKWTSKTKKKKKRKKNVKTSKDSVSLLNYWKENADNILRKCNIKAFQNESENRIVLDFENPELRASYLEYFGKEESFFLNKEFDYLFYNQGLIIDAKITDNVFSNFIGFCAYMAKRNPRNFTLHKLMTLTVHLGSSKLATNNEISNVKEMIEFQYHNIQFENFKKGSFIKISRIIIQLLEVEAIRPILNEFWNSLINGSDQHTKVAFELIKILRNTPNFDKFKWLKEILNRGKTELKLEAYNHLIYTVSKSSFYDLYESLSVIRGWWDHESFNINTHSNIFGATFLYNYCISSINSLQYGEYGELPSKYPLFSTIQSENLEEDSNKFDYLVSWLFDEKVVEAYMQVSGKNEKETLNLSTKIIDQWIQIVIGYEERDENGARLALVKSMISKIVKRLTVKEKISIMKSFSSLRNFYLESINQASVTNRKERSFYRASRNNVKLTINYLKQA